MARCSSPSPASPGRQSSFAGRRSRVRRPPSIASSSPRWCLYRGVWRRRSPRPGPAAWSRHARGRCCWRWSAASSSASTWRSTTPPSCARRRRRRRCSGTTRRSSSALDRWLLFKRPPRRTFWIGLALAVAGAAIMMVAAAAGKAGGRGDLAGAGMAIAAAFFFAGYLLTTEHVREEMDTLTFSTIAVVGSVLTLLVVCLVLDSSAERLHHAHVARPARARAHLAARRLPRARLRARPPSRDDHVRRAARAGPAHGFAGGASPRRTADDAVSDRRRARPRRDLCCEPGNQEVAADRRDPCKRRRYG